MHALWPRHAHDVLHRQGPLSGCHKDRLDGTVIFIGEARRRHAPTVAGSASPVALAVATVTATAWDSRTVRRRACRRAYRRSGEMTVPLSGPCWQPDSGPCR